MCITSLFTSNLHIFWSFEFLTSRASNSLPKMDFGKCSKFHLKVKVHVTTRFWVPNFHTNLMNLASCLVFYVCMPYFLLHNGHSLFLKLMISSSCLSLYFMNLDLLIFSFYPISFFQNLYWFNLYSFLPLNLI